MRAFWSITRLWLITVGCASIFSAQAQSFSGDSISAKFGRFRTENIQEKLYAHISQNLYLVGENMWFAIYCVDGTLHKPLSISKVAYVELLDKNNRAVIQTKVQLEAGLGNGSFFLPATIESGVYTLRCYTNWMKNFAPEFFFHQPVTIVNPFVKPAFEKSQTNSTPIVEFFPEGGHLVNGLESKLAFKIVNQQGNGLHGSVTILDANNQVVAKAIPLKFGIGYLTVTPAVENGPYRAEVTLESGATSTHRLPEIESKGAVMTLKRQQGLVNIHVARNTDQLFELRLFAHCRNQIVKTENKRFTGNEIVFSVDEQLIPDGITHFTIFDQDQNPICERLFFRKPSLVPVAAMTDFSSEHKARRKVAIHIKTGTSAANLSVSIVREDSLGGEPNQNILSNLLLTSDIRGYVQSPDYYLSADNAVEQAADNLMLTHGWRRFSWDQVFAATKPKYFAAEYRGHIITGKVMTRTDSIASGVLTYLASPGKIINLYASRSNENGVITFEPSEFFGQHRLILQAEPRSASSVKMEITSPFASVFAKYLSKPFTLDPSIESKFLDRSVAMQVQDVYYEETSATPSSTIIDSVSFYGTADETYYLDAYTRFPVMEEVMREYVPGVLVRKRKDGFHFVVLDVVNGGILNDDPMILLDGVPLFDADNIMSVDPRVIRKLEVIKRNYYVGPMRLNGIVSYTSYQGNLGGIDLGPEAPVVNYEGLQLQREFYSPRYDTQKQIDSRMPDRRYQLYWNPAVKTGADGTAVIEFYTSDVTGTFSIDIQALDKDGKAGSLRKTFVVK